MMHDGGALQARHMLGSYEILDAVGHGGMGIVYRAHDHILGRVVALKVLRDDLRLQNHLVSRFQREARAVAALDHPNIVQVYAVGAIAGLPYIAMEFIEGQPLSDLLRDRESLSWDEALRIGEQVAQGLAAAHDKAIYHRDIKPGNILLDPQGRAYLTDFGIAKVVNADTQLTVDGSRLGTPHYMAPERCEGRDAGAASDLYALGIVLYQCIAGRLPFTAGTPAELIEQILAQPLRPVSQYAPGAPIDVDRLVAWVTEKDPRHRPANAHRLADAMQRVLAGMPLDEAGPNLAGALAEFRERLHTPTPAPPGANTPITVTAFERFERFWSALRWRWRALPLALRMFAAAALSAAAAFAIAWPLLNGAAIDARQALLARPNAAIDRWTVPPAPGIRGAEGPNLSAVRFALDGYAVASVAPAADGAVHALLSASEAPGRWTALAHIAEDGAVTLRGAPIALPRGGAAHLLAMGGSETGGAVLLRNEEGAALVHWSDGGPAPALAFADPVSGEPFDLGPVSAAGNAVAAAVRTPEGWRVALFAHGADGRFVFQRLAAAAGGEITAIRYAPGTGNIAILRRTGRDYALSILDLRRGDAAERAIATGALTLPAACWDATAERIAVLEERDGAPWLVLHPLQGPGAPQTFAEAADAALLSNGVIAILAPDRRGDAQLWRIAGAAPAEQRTYLDGGLVPGSLAAVGPGRVAAAGARGAAYVDADFTR